MAQIYSDPSRENDPGALPDVEVFYVTAAHRLLNENVRRISRSDGTGMSVPAANFDAAGWYWSPRGLGISYGPFATEQEAIDDARGDAAACPYHEEDAFESSCSECCADEGFTHIVTLPKSRCAACGYNSHHYAAQVTVTPSGEAYASATYSGADDPAGNFPEVNVSEYGPMDGAEVLISWCCGAPTVRGSEWSGAQCEVAPDSCWVDDDTGEHVNAVTGARTRTHDAQRGE